MIKLKAVLSCDHCKKSEECTCTVEASLGHGGSIEIQLYPDSGSGWQHRYATDYCHTCAVLLKLDK